MAYASSLRVFPTRSFGILSKVAHTYISWNQSRKTKAALFKLSARELDDIGLTYADIQDRF